MAKKFSELRSTLSPAALQRSDAKAKVMLAEMLLHELQQAHNLLQNTEGEAFQIQKSSIATSLPC